MLMSNHPSPLSALRASCALIGNGHFGKGQGVQAQTRLLRWPDWAVSALFPDSKPDARQAAERHHRHSEQRCAVGKLPKNSQPISMAKPIWL